MSRINHNISSLQAIHRLIANQQSMSTSLERLSSGLRINRGKDDPAGLIASENLRAEIRGINAAIENSVRANNVISTAEGALNEVSALLLEVRGLVTKSANTGAMADEELEANQLQIDSILESIDRIANTTQFNGKKLLDGSLEYNLSTVATSALAEVKLYAAKPPENGSLPVVVEVTNSAEFAQLKFSGAGTGAASAVSIRVAGNVGSEVFSFGASTAISAMAATINSFSDVLGVSASLSSTGALYFNSTGYGTSAFVSVTSIGSEAFKTYDPVDGAATASTGSTDYGVDAEVTVNGQNATVDGLYATLRNNSLDMELYLTADFGTRLTSTQFGVSGGGAIFQLAPNVQIQGQVSMGIYSVSTGTLGNNELGYLSSVRSGGANSVVSEHSIQAQRIVDRSVTQVSVMRGRLGAFQKNTLDTNINSLQVALENVTASESSIRDTDFAEETAAMTRAQILVQATTTILRTANMAPQNALALLG
ncbi:MAG: flagellin [Phycisphaerae bacterium]|nr:flagellin [Phycisphaerae bacterium]